MTDILKEQKEQQLFCTTLGLLVSFMPLMTFINTLCNLIIGEGFSYDTIACYGLVWAFLGLSLYKCFKKLSFDVWAFLAIFGTLWVYTYLCMTINKFFMLSSFAKIQYNPFYLLFVYSLPGFILSRCIWDYEMLHDVLRKFSIAVVLSSIFHFYVNFFVNEFQIGYMGLSYNMLLHTTYLILGNFKKHTRLYRIIGLIGLFLIFIAGCRGAIVCFGVCYTIKLFFDDTNISAKVFKVTFSIILVVIAVFLFEEVVNLLIGFTDSIGLNSRTLVQLQRGRFFDDSGRQEIQSLIIRDLNWIGHGMYGDRLTNERFGSYSHNLIIELLSHYGYLLGAVFSIYIISLLVRGITTKNKRLSLLIIVFISAGFVKLFFSSSYLAQEPAFYALLGLCTNAFKGTSKNKKEMPANTEVL